MERNDPRVVVEVGACFAAYEQALVEGDFDALAAFFDDSTDLVRVGIADLQRGPDELAAWRASQGPLPKGRTLSSTVVSTFGRDFAVVSTLFSYPGREKLGRQSQTWVRIDERWRIVHAHVSEVPATILSRFSADASVT